MDNAEMEEKNLMPQCPHELILIALNLQIKISPDVMHMETEDRLLIQIGTWDTQTQILFQNPERFVMP